MARRSIPTLTQAIAFAVLVATQAYVWSMLRQTSNAKTFASGPPPAGIEHLDGERATVNGVSGRFAEKIFFYSDRASTASRKAHIWMINPDGTGLEQVTFGDGDDTGVAISPDGLELAFGRAVPSSDPNGPMPQSIWVKDLVTGAEKQITAEFDWPMSVYQSLEPAWSPDGKTLAFSRQPLFGTDGFDRFMSIWTVDVKPSASAPNRLKPASRFGQSNPAWSRDGRHVLYAKQLAADERLAIYRVDLKTGQEEEVIPCTGDEYEPRYSPDGSKVLWTTNRHTDPSDARSDVYIADLADPIGTQHRVSPYSGWGYADWSPDGTRLVMVQPLLKLTDQSLASLEELGLSRWLVLRLSSVKHTYFLEGRDLLAEARPIIGEEATARLVAKILQRCATITTLWIANADGSGLTRLFESTSGNFSPRWAVVFQCDVDDRVRR